MNDNARTKRITNMLILWSALIAAGIVLFLLAKHCGLRVPCVFNLLTGFDCPGCGNTRAVLALSQLDLKASLAYNPMLIPQLTYIGWILLSCTKQYVHSGRFSYGIKIRIIDILAITAIIVWWIVRNL